MKSLIIILSLFTVSLSNIQETYNSKLLFCLHKNVPLLEIHNSSETQFSELNKIFKLYNVTNIEQWLPGSTENDFDGDIYLNRIYRIHFSEKEINSLNKFAMALNRLEVIHSVELEHIRKPHYTPNDQYYNQQWYLQAINSNDAWNYWTNNGNIPGNENVILASVDTGVNWTHADLRNNLWQNLGEDANGNGQTVIYSGGQYILDPGDLNGVDDDDWDNNSNTFIDDLIGWDPAGLGGLDDNNPDPPNNNSWAHGTHVAGLLSATTDNSTGIASTAFNCRIMSVKVSDENQSGDIYITDGFAGILYAAKAGYFSQGFSIINNSWGGGGFSNYENSVINTCVNDYNAIIVCSGGNGSDTGWGEAYEISYPAGYENSISVCPLGTNNSWNHWGTYHETIDLASPGENIRSCTTPNNYQSWDGSSMASPAAASVFGLLKAYNMIWDNEMVKTMVLATADPVIYSVNSENYLNGMLGKGRVDALKAISTPLFPKIEYSGEDINIINDFDGNINPGENIELSVILFNNPEWGDALNAQGVLTCLNPDVNISNQTINFGNIPSGDVGINIENPFQISFSENLTDSEVIFTLYFISNVDGYIEYNQTLPITLSITENPILTGDLNQDSIINILDVVQLVNIILGNSIASDYQNLAGDINQDGGLNIQDIIILINSILQ